MEMEEKDKSFWLFFFFFYLFNVSDFQVSLWRLQTYLAGFRQDQWEKVPQEPW